MIFNRSILCCILLVLCACAQTPDKTDWLQNAEEYAPDSASASPQDDSLSNVSHAHTGEHH